MEPLEHNQRSALRWGVEIISEAHRRQPLDEALADAHCTTMALFDSLTVDMEQAGP